MTTFFLALISGQLFGFHKESVAGVGAGKKEKDLAKKHNDGRRYIRLPNGEAALFCDLRPLLDNRPSSHHPTLNDYLILHHGHHHIALPMEDKGRWIMAAETTALSLPPAFTGRSRTLTPKVIINMPSHSFVVS